MRTSLNLTFPTARGLFSIGDDKFVKPREPVKRPAPLEIYKFRYPKIFLKSVKFNKNNLPLEFQTTPDTLLHLAARVVDALPLPRIYEWSNLDCCTWIRKYGYPQYQNTFRENLITGRNLLLVDAQALSAMNIKDFEHILHIAYGIRQLFYFEMTKFMRNISLPPQYYYELYKLFQVKTGRSFQSVRRTDLWRRMQLLRPIGKSNFHWDLLERWLSREQDTVELIGGRRRHNIYRCTAQLPPQSPQGPSKICTCRTFCTCYWNADNLRRPTLMTILKPFRTSPKQIELDCCQKCMPPCTCHWPPRYYRFNSTLSCLRQNFPSRYNANERARLEMVGSFYSVESRLVYG